ILMWAGLGLGALAIAGGPLTGGMWTKYLVKTFLGDTTLPGGQTFLLLLTLSAVTTTLLLSRFLHVLSRTEAPAGNKAPAFLLPWTLLLLAGGWWTMSPALLPAELMNYITKEKGILSFFWNLLTNWGALWPIIVGLLLMVLSLKIAFLSRWPVKKPLLPPGDFLHILLKIGNLLAKILRKGISLLDSGMKSLHGPEKIFYRISDDKRTSQISSSAESILRRWEFAGIGFFIFFLVMFLLL
ncbi:MAG: hypothetical protein ACLFS0_09770, partial [Bacteroidales bacterium]